MNYKRLRISFNDAKKEFYRNLYIREDVNLAELGYILCAALSTEFSHMFGFKTKDGFIDMEDKALFEKTVGSIEKKFTFIYDFGEDWAFTCTISPSDYELDETSKALFIGGKGQGVWEDNKASLLMYLEGKINPRAKKDNPEKGYFLPSNFAYAPYGFFSYPLDKKAEKEAMKDFSDNYLDRIIKNM